VTTYRSLQIKPGPPALPAPSAVPLHPTSLATAHAAQKALDTLIEPSSRVLMEWGLKGAAGFMIPNGANPSSGGTRVYPDKSTPRVVGRLKNVAVMPGHFVGFAIVALPSGPVQTVKLDDGTFIPDGAGGSVEIEVTYYNGDAQSTTVYATAAIPASNEIYAAEPPSAYDSLLTFERVAVPLQFNAGAEDWEKWTRGNDVRADVIIREIGSTRIIDGQIIERPNTVVVDVADLRWPSAMYTAGGQPYGNPPSDYPIQQLTDADAGGGTLAIQRAIFNHGRQLGPFLWGWTSARQEAGALLDWISYGGGTGDNEAPPYSVSGTTPTLVPHGITTKSPNNPGWSLGNYAREADHGDHFFDGRTGVIRVWVGAYCRVSGGVGTYTLIGGDHPMTDRVQWTCDSTSWRWVEAYGYLECGTSPQSSTLARLWISNSGADNVEIRNCQVQILRR
jgi:hypothetical protein